MTTNEFDWPVRLKSKQDDLSPLMFFMGGLSILLLTGPLVIGLWRGEIEALGILLFPGFAIGFAYLLSYLSRPQDYAVLYPDKIEFPGKSKKRRVLLWSEVKSIQWPKEKKGDKGIRMKKLDDKIISFDHCWESRSLTLPEWLTLIRYVRQSTKDIEQIDWKPFCCHIAVPMAEKCRREEKMPVDSYLYPWPPRLAKLLKHHPFVAGLLGPLYLPFFLQRRAWWMFSAVIATSTLLNIHLFWGKGDFRTVTILWGLCAVATVCGFFASSGRSFLIRLDHSSNQEKNPLSIFWILLPLIGIVVPFMVNMEIKGLLPQGASQIGYSSSLIIIIGLACWYKSLS